MFGGEINEEEMQKNFDFDTIFAEFIKRNLERKKFYFYKIQMSEDEKVNGYNLFETSDNIMDYDLFIELREIYLKNEQILDDEFLEWLENNCCWDWSKMDRHGECFGGFWKYPEGSYERENALDLSRKDNFESLLELPYPRKLIGKTIDLGCNNRMESVRYSNFMSEWIKRKSEQISLIYQLDPDFKRELKLESDRIAAKPGGVLYQKALSNFSSLQ